MVESWRCRPHVVVRRRDVEHAGRTAKHGCASRRRGVAAHVVMDQMGRRLADPWRILGWIATTCLRYHHASNKPLSVFLFLSIHLSSDPQASPENSHRRRCQSIALLTLCELSSCSAVCRLSFVTMGMSISCFPSSSHVQFLHSIQSIDTDFSILSLTSRDM